MNRYLDPNTDKFLNQDKKFETLLDIFYPFYQFNILIYKRKTYKLKHTLIFNNLLKL